MAVAEDEKVEKAEKADKKAAAGRDAEVGLRRRPGPSPSAIDWLPRKWRRAPGASSSRCARELKKVTWPSRKEVYATTIVVMATTVFFGFYL